MRKLLSLGLAIALMTANIGTAFAGDIPAISGEVGTVTVLAADTVDRSVVQRFEEGVMSAVVHEDGSMTPVDVVVTITELPATRTVEGKRYAISAKSTAKVDSKASDMQTNGVYASQTLTMDWTDVSGKKNTIDNLSGNIRITKGTLEKMVVSWGQPRDMSGGTNEFFVTSFDFATEYTSTAGASGTIQANLTTHFEETSDTLVTTVKPTIFD